VLATGRVLPNGAGFHVRRPVKSSLYSVFRCLAQHLLGGFADGYLRDRQLFFLLLFYLFYFFCHVVLLRKCW
jgi:hypothetical protein